MARIVLITGASSGFGAACARRFARDGDALVLGARRVERLQRLQAELEAHCPVHVGALDVREAASVDAFLSGLPEGFRDVAVLVNNAGLALGMDPAWRASWDDWDTMIATNVRGLAYVSRRVLPGMVERGRGHVVNLGSTAGAWPYPGGNVYGATKAFVQQFSRNLRADLVGTPIRVSSIDPGLAETEFSQVRFHGDQDKARGVYEGTRPLNAADVADIVHWVVSAPAHVNINAVEVMPTGQAWGPLAVHRDSGT